MFLIKFLKPYAKPLSQGWEDTNHLMITSNNGQPMGLKNTDQKVDSQIFIIISWTSSRL